MGKNSLAARLTSFLGALALLAFPGISTAQSTGTSSTTTPIQHVVVIFQENVSFDHYFGTYPNAANPAGEPAFTAAPDTPSVNGLTQALLTHNPNQNNPSRLDRSQPVTCDMDHGYTNEQKAVDGGLMDKFVQSTTGKNCGNVSVMDYYDGNTVTAMWNYAQHFAMNDNSFGTNYGPSTPGALNLVSGQTHGATPANIAGKVANGTVYSDLDPGLDDCSKAPTNVMSGQNVGDLLNAKGVTWGWFEGGFRPTGTTSDGKALCGASSVNVGGAKVTDYIPHHEPFQYYASTANPHHLAPTSTAMIGHTDQANHQYDLVDFWAAAQAGNLPAVSFLKAKAYQDGHAGYSDPLDEQAFLVDTINRLQQLPTWSSTAVIINYDDSDGWYDHVMGPIVSQSNDPKTDVTCGAAASGAYLDRCGYGPRLPMMVISPYARANFVDNTLTDQSSILRFIEDNWSLGRVGDQSFDAIAGPLTAMFDWSRVTQTAPYLLDTTTGEPTSGGTGGTTAGATTAGGTQVSGTLAAGTSATYTFAYPGDSSQIGVTLTYSPADPYTDANVTLQAKAPNGATLGYGSIPGKPGTKYWQLGSTTRGTYTLVVKNADPLSRAVSFTITTSAKSSTAVAPALGG